MEFPFAVGLIGSAILIVASFNGDGDGYFRRGTYGAWSGFWKMKLASKG